jgi:hypothetical protein
VSALTSESTASAVARNGKEKEARSEEKEKDEGDEESEKGDGDKEDKDIHYDYFSEGDAKFEEELKSLRVKYKKHKN